MATTTTTANTDLPRQPSICSSLSTLLADLQNQDMYSTYPSESGGGTSMIRSEDEVWEEGMTLEDFLTKAGAVREEDVKECVVAAMEVHHKTDNNNSNNNTSNGIEKIMNKNGERRYNKRRCGVVVEEVALDKATQQKQRRMIKNRESAARSRERKQAYTIELESLVTQLEEENARLRRQEVEHRKKRYKQLMENLIPVVDKRRPPPSLPPPPQVLRRVNSVQW